MDALNYSIALDKKMSDMWKPLAPHHNIFLTNKPREISQNISIPKPVVNNFSTWLSDITEEVTDPEILARFDAIPCV